MFLYLFYNVIAIFIFQYPVPAAPPQNVQTTAISSTEIMVTWDEIPGLDQNGIIIEYEVEIEPLDFPADLSLDLLTTTSLSIVITGLQEYVFYNISVRAYTSVGPGPYSDPVTERTFEDGNVPIVVFFISTIFISPLPTIKKTAKRSRIACTKY